jgi:23S rRNA pseudouridine1911/1915/1917 synthase
MAEKYSVTKANTLLKFLFEILSGQSRTSVRELLKNGQVQLNGTINRQFDTQLQVADIVTVSHTRPVEQREFQHPLMEIVWMDKDLVVIFKDEGLLSVSGSPSQKISAHYILSQYFQSLHPHNKLYLLHRLDKGTSGLMMFSRTLEAQRILRANWHNMITRRTYFAVTEGRPPCNEDTVITYLAENKRQRVYCTDPAHGKEAISHYRLLFGNSNYSLLELNLETGRKNQIRAQMEYLGCPIAGDRKYGAFTDPAMRLMLHAGSLWFIHPITNEEMKFDYSPPNVFYDICKIN